MDIEPFLLQNDNVSPAVSVFDKIGMDAREEFLAPNSKFPQQYRRQFYLVSIYLCFGGIGITAHCVS